jgi:hypothetical protein
MTEAEPQDLEALARWHRQKARAAVRPADRDFHVRAAKLIAGVLKQRADHAASIKAGQAKAREEGRSTGGSPRIDAAIEARIRKMLSDGVGTRAIMAEVGCGAALVVRVKRELGLALGKPGRPSGE